MPKAYASTVLNAPGRGGLGRDPRLQRPAGLASGIADSMIEDGKASDQVGCVRSMHLQDGAHIRERLISCSDVDRHYSYNFETTPFDVLNYHATLRVTPVTDGDRSFVEWWTTFDCEPGQDRRVDRTPSPAPCSRADWTR